MTERDRDSSEIQWYNMKESSERHIAIYTIHLMYELVKEDNYRSSES